MAEKEISDEKKIEDNVSLLQKKLNKFSFLSSHSNSYCETTLEMITFDYTWRIYHFKDISETLTTLMSSSFPENNQYMIKMERIFLPEGQFFRNKYNIKLYLCTTAPFFGSCKTTIICNTSSVKLIQGHILHMTMLYEGNFYYFDDPLTIYCEFKIFCDLENTSINVCDLPSSTVSKDLKSFEDSTLDKSKNEESITFIVSNTKRYDISKKILWASNSNYFKNICLTCEAKEKDLTELEKYELEAFEQILLFIVTGSETVETYDYNMLTNVLLAADKYDVQTLKPTCEYYLLQHITIENALKLINLAISSNAKLLEMHLAIFIKIHVKEIFNSEKLHSDLKHLNDVNLNKIVELIDKYDTYKMQETITPIQHRNE
ncbi:speckle-type POZ protein B [Solenopsis invicta]|uniref:speckle-type POZ protein B n=1 Tax=Solenopsis invicta TaxID=13686 RepID=UPI00193D0AD6|nr:speckle-type POZ protein B [Solenopsis invicta]